MCKQILVAFVLRLVFRILPADFFSIACLSWFYRSWMSAHWCQGVFCWKLHLYYLNSWPELLFSQYTYAIQCSSLVWYFALSIWIYMPENFRNLQELWKQFLVLCKTNLSACTIFHHGCSHVLSNKKVHLYHIPSWKKAAQLSKWLPQTLKNALKWSQSSFGMQQNTTLWERRFGRGCTKRVWSLLCVRICG